MPSNLDPYDRVGVGVGIIRAINQSHAAYLALHTSTDEGEVGDWFSSSWGFAKQILPLLLFGVLVAGALLGRVGNEGLIPSQWVAGAVGGNSFMAASQSFA